MGPKVFAAADTLVTAADTHPPAGAAASGRPSAGLKRFYRPSEVARLLEVSVRTVYRRIEDGTIPAMNDAGPWRIPVAEFHRRFPGVNAAGRVSR